jgi:hypothetical protein
LGKELSEVVRFIYGGPCFVGYHKGFKEVEYFTSVEGNKLTFPLNEFDNGVELTRSDGLVCFNLFYNSFDYILHKKVPLRQVFIEISDQYYPFVFSGLIHIHILCV